ncbi:MAG: hypothetical protein M1133_16190 [Armatimonadetes bacterium]|nr:hypothetical protein [Armatimonadota bacterium]
MKTRVLAIFIGMLIVVMAAGLATGDPHTAQYKGTAACTMCHKGMHKAIVESYQKVDHPKAMQKADAAGAIVADFAGSPFPKDKVAFVLGKGTREQAYLDANLQVLPGAWDIKSKAWKATPAADGATQCVGCHTTGYDAEKKSYTELGVGCEACHGPGSEHMAKPSKDNAPNPAKLSGKLQGMVCGSCHSLGKDTSGKYAFPVGFRPGDDLTKCFVDAKPTAPGRNQQYSELMQSKHGQMGFSCATCHDAHGTTGLAAQLKKPINDGCMSCHAAKIKDMKTHAPAAPADATCATCHMPGGQHTFKKPGA